ncbi:MFS sugar transporter [Penicillium waksmanii]|uniref:MFS sugar transporter n=1 Tax=Penicillium waksmanii TaxID=69791 RepID=UPI002547AF83|nr:MFS sugar transporter [Penicillium waksmanii]KAJ5982848.1 MFS sugar transporter [Penicillium waksmanii]
MVKQEKNAVGGMLAEVIPPDSQAWWTKPHLVRLNTTITGLLLYSRTVGYDGSLMNGMQSLGQWKEFMDHPAGAWLGFINAIQFLGVMLGLPLQAWAANRFGRKRTIFVGFSSLLSVQHFRPVQPTRPCSSLLVSWSDRLVPGSKSIVLITEIAYPTHPFGCRNNNSSWAWRILSLLQMGIPLFALPLTLNAPESPRWFISKDRHEEARQMLVKHHAGGDQNSLLVASEMEEIIRSIAKEQEAENSTGWVDMKLISFSGIVSYYLTLILDNIGITSVTEQLMINGFLQIWNLIMAVVGALLVDRIGRGFAETDSRSIGISVIPLLFVYFAGYDIAFTPLLLSFPVEIWQFSLWAKGVAFTSTCTYFALLFNSFVNPIALEAIQWKYYFV